MVLSLSLDNVGHSAYNYLRGLQTMKQLFWALVAGAALFIVVQGPRAAESLQQHRADCISSPETTHNCAFVL